MELVSSLKEVDEIQALGEDSTLAVRRGRRGHRWGAPTAPAASQLSAPELTRLDTGLLSRRPAWIAVTSGLTLNTRGAGAGSGRGQAGLSPGDPPGFQSLQDSRVSEPPACAPGPAYKLAFKGSLWFFFFFSLSLFPPGPDKDKLAKDAVPGGGGACSATQDFHQGCLSRSAAR